MEDTIYRVKKLDEVFTKKNRVYKLKKRNEKIAIYELTDAGVFMGYEVIKIKFFDSKKLIESLERRAKKKYEGDLLNFDKVEIYPKNEDFGKKGWFFMSYERKRAIKKYDELASV